MSTSTSPKQRPCYLLKLPAELRLEIYVNVFSLSSFDAQAPRAKRAIYPSLLYTYTQIFCEARAAFNEQCNWIGIHVQDSLSASSTKFPWEVTDITAQLNNGVVIDQKRFQTLAAMAEREYAKQSAMMSMVLRESQGLERLSLIVDSRQ